VQFLLIIFFLPHCAQYSPVQNLTIRYFNVSADAVNWLSLIYMLVYIPGGIITNLCFDYFGLYNYVRYNKPPAILAIAYNIFKFQMQMMFAAVLNFVGSWLRIIGSLQGSPWFFGMVMLGQTLCAICQCFTFSIPNVIASQWFPDNERTLAVAIAGIANQFGGGVGYICSPLIVTVANYKYRFLFMAIIQAVACTFAGAACILWFEERPPTPPSPSAAALLETSSSSRKLINFCCCKKTTSRQRLIHSSKEQDEDSVEAINNSSTSPNDEISSTTTNSNSSPFLRQLQVVSPFWNVHFLILMHSIGTAMGCYGAILTLMNELSEEKGFTAVDAGNFGFASMVGSLPYSLFAAWFVDKTKWYNFNIKFNGLLSAASYAMLVMCLELDFLRIKILIYIANILLGSFVNAALTIYLESSVEVAFPVSPGLSSAYILVATQVYSILMTLCLQFMYETKWIKKYTLYASMAFVVLSMLLTVFFNGKMKRFEMEREALGNQGKEESEANGEAEKKMLLA